MLNASIMSLQVAMSIDMMAWCRMAALERDASAEGFFRIGSVACIISLAQPESGLAKIAYL
jgi:hypothetical protein